MAYEVMSPTYRIQEAEPGATEAGNPGRLILVTLSGEVSAPLMDLLAHLLRWGLPRVLYLDGANAFDPHRLVRAARQRGLQPRGALSRIHLSRAFTCHQLEALVGEQLEERLQGARGDGVVVGGITELFLDEAVSLAEARAVLARTLRRLQVVSRAGHQVLLTHHSTPEERTRLPAFLPLLHQRADRWVRLIRPAGDREPLRFLPMERS